MAELLKLLINEYIYNDITKVFKYFKFLEELKLRQNLSLLIGFKKSRDQNQGLEILKLSSKITLSEESYIRSDLILALLG
jgi:ABC-type lipoprotein export system ATPase subunit